MREYRQEGVVRRQDSYILDGFAHYRKSNRHGHGDVVNEEWMQDIDTYQIPLYIVDTLRDYIGRNIRTQRGMLRRQQ